MITALETDETPPPMPLGIGAADHAQKDLIARGAVARQVAGMEKHPLARPAADENGWNFVSRHRCLAPRKPLFRRQ
jgi:hypothetical protein